MPPYTMSELERTTGIRLFDANQALQLPQRVLAQCDFCPVHCDDLRRCWRNTDDDNVFDDVIRQLNGPRRQTLSKFENVEVFTPFKHAGARAVALAKFLLGGWKGWGTAKILETRCMQFSDTQVPPR